MFRWIDHLKEHLSMGTPREDILAFLLLLQKATGFLAESVRVAARSSVLSNSRRPQTRKNLCSSQNVSERVPFDLLNNNPLSTKGNESQAGGVIQKDDAMMTSKRKSGLALLPEYERYLSSCGHIYSNPTKSNTEDKNLKGQGNSESISLAEEKLDGTLNNLSLEGSLILPRIINLLHQGPIYHPDPGSLCLAARLLISQFFKLKASQIESLGPSRRVVSSRELYRIMEFVRNMERRRLIKPQDILATLQSIPEDESESELQEHVFDSDSDEDFIPQNISSESEDSEGTNPEDIPSTSTGDRAHAVMLPRDHPPGRGQKKSAKRPRNERTTDNDGGEGNATTNTREGESEGILVSADGIQWKPVEIGEHLPGRRDSQNILREAPGPTGYARRNIIIDSPLSAWRLFFDSYILTHIKNCTLAEACRNNNLQFTLSDEELDAFIAIFYARGISGTNIHSISSIWCNDWGIPFCKATMSRDRFVEIMRFLRFYEKSTRSERLQTDKFALFSTVWDRFIENCIACYKPGPYITVDEQLFPSKTRCPFTQYMPSKPDKYGHKYWLAVDKRSKYLANGFPYLGKDDTRRAEDRLADHVVMKLLDPFLKKGRNVTTDNYFTSVKLAKQLKSKGTTIVGTLNKIRREVPKEIKSMKEELYNTKVFRNEDNFTLTVYQGKPNKNVVILSSVHPDVVVASDSGKKTPETVKFYNETKYGVDVVDQMARKYTTRTCTRRWPVHAFENALDFAGINAWIIFKEITHQKMSRKAFLQTLVRELSGPYVTDREKGSTSQVSTCSEVMVQTKNLPDQRKVQEK
ncbi:uncharacterized protein [Phyllobates terribilis]|uniref:uncharacterized protein n=1 Tax=Phyllobates terribilis TaxID=111132 RepID=UPI003CCAD765